MSSTDQDSTHSAVPLALKHVVSRPREETNPNFEVTRAPRRRERRAWTKIGSFVREYTPFGRTIEAVEEAMRPTTGSNCSRSRSFSTSANDEELHYMPEITIICDPRVLVRSWSDLSVPYNSFHSITQFIYSDRKSNGMYCNGFC